MKQIVAKKTLGKRSSAVTYLVEWLEYPGEPTWEPPQNLLNVQGLVDQFEATVKKERETAQDRSANLDLRRKRTLKQLRKGSLDNQNHRIENVIGIRLNKHDGQLEGKVTWRLASKDDENREEPPEASHVPINYLRHNHAMLLLEYFEGLAGLDRYKAQNQTTLEHI